MSQTSEIKCPHCGKWSESTGNVDATCNACGHYIEPERHAHGEERKIAIAQQGNYYLVIKDSDETITEIFKMFINSIRWSAYYMVMLFFIIVGAMIFIFGILAAA